MNTTATAAMLTRDLSGPDAKHHFVLCFSQQKEQCSELASRITPPWANSAVRKIGTGTEITPKLHPVLIVHALILQTRTHIPPVSSPVD